jgi:hypothetical protein
MLQIKGAIKNTERLLIRLGVRCRRGLKESVSKEVTPTRSWVSASSDQRRKKGTEMSSAPFVCRCAHRLRCWRWRASLILPGRDTHTLPTPAGLRGSPPATGRSGLPTLGVYCACGNPVFLDHSPPGSSFPQTPLTNGEVTPSQPELPMLLISIPNVNCLCGEAIDLCM